MNGGDASIGEASIGEASIGEASIGDASIGVRLDPREAMLFRDGRPFGPSASVRSGLPSPQTFAGALTFALCESFARPGSSSRDANDRLDVLRRFHVPESLRAMRFRGPWLARGDEVLVATPADVVVEDKGGNAEPRRLAVPAGPPAGWRDDKLLPLWLPDADADEFDLPPLKPAGGRVAVGGGLAEWAAGGTPTADQIVADEKLFCFEAKLGIGRDVQTRTAGDAEIYAARLLRLREGVGFYGEVVVPAGAADEAAAWLDSVVDLRFGGEAKRVGVRRVEVAAWPTPPAAGPCVALLTAPAAFAAPPYTLPPAAVVAAAVPGQVAVGGWDLARRRPRPTRFCCPPGSVYHLAAPPAVPQWAGGEDSILGFGTLIVGGPPQRSKP